jgi:hypothetical protein
MAKNNGMMRALKDYWFLIMAAVTVIGLGFKILDIEKDFNSHKNIVGHSGSITRISKMETDIEWIKKSNERIEDKLDRISQ